MNQKQEGNWARKIMAKIIYNAPRLHKIGAGIPGLRRLWRTVNIRLRRRPKRYLERQKCVLEFEKKYGLEQVAASPIDHVIIIAVDSMRWDHTSLAGYSRNTTPVLAEIAQRGVVFENAYTAAPWTYPSVVSILTGLYPSRHGAVLMAEYGDATPETCSMLSKPQETVAFLSEMLSMFGFRTLVVGSVGAEVWFNADYFHRYLPTTAYHCIAETARFVTKLSSKKSFVYCHLQGPHLPLIIPRRYRGVFGYIPNLPNIIGWDFHDREAKSRTGFEEYREARIKLYDAALRYSDDLICHLFSLLKKTGLIHRTLLIITADHGDGLWDHWEEDVKYFDLPERYGIDHGHTVYEEVIRVPLILVAPGVEPRRVETPCSLVDIVPTVVELCGLRTDFEFDGHSLLNLPEERTIFSESTIYGYEKKAVIKGEWKLHHCEGDGVTLLYNLAKDPSEKQDLSMQFPHKVQELLEELRKLKKTEVERKKVEMDAFMVQRLRQLGYIE